MSLDETILPGHRRGTAVVAPAVLVVVVVESSSPPPPAPTSDCTTPIKET